VCPLAVAQENALEPTQTIHVSVDRVNVGVIVTDHSGHFVEGLHREDFHVFRQWNRAGRLPAFASVEEAGAGTSRHRSWSGRLPSRERPISKPLFALLNGLAKR